MLQSKYPYKQSYSTNDVASVNEDQDSYVFKKFINAAIYVEKTIKKMAPDYQNYQKHLAESIRIMKTKRCSCAINADSCPCHPSMASGDGLESRRSDTHLSSQQKNKLMESEQAHRVELKQKYEWQPLVTLKQKPVNLRKEEIKTKNITKCSKLKFQSLNDDIPYRDPLSATALGEIASRPNKSIEIEKTKSMLRELNTKESHAGVTNEEVDETKLPEFQREIGSPYEAKSGRDQDEQTTNNQSLSSSTSSTTLSTCSQITVKRSDKAFKNEMKISLSSLTSFTPSENESVRQWLSKKLEEQKQKQLALQKEQKRKEVERQKILQKERENFKDWLVSKGKRREEKS
ncbi:hypothetical protein HHI36_007468 [Cryptolaemus montrouzieri]|uniref:Uncharacterized protein n=1 Tax=Cryptolaemus montrouzieri TaxID=559131 RepID=A0ABD2MPQ8_9CUCU